MPGTYELPLRIDSGLLEALHELADRQHGVARRDELYGAGLSVSALNAMVGAGRWRTRGEVVVVMHNGPLSRDQQLWAAVRNAGWPSALAARTAAAGYGLVGWAAECIEILVVKGALIPRGLGFDVKVHESRASPPMTFTSAGHSRTSASNAH